MTANRMMPSGIGLREGIGVEGGVRVGVEVSVAVGLGVPIRVALGVAVGVGSGLAVAVTVGVPGGGGVNSCQPRSGAAPEDSVEGVGGIASPSLAMYWVIPASMAGEPARSTRPLKSSSTVPHNPSGPGFGGA